MNNKKYIKLKETEKMAGNKEVYLFKNKILERRVKKKRK